MSDTHILYGMTEDGKCEICGSDKMKITGHADGMYENITIFRCENGHQAATAREIRHGN